MCRCDRLSVSYTLAVQAGAKLKLCAGTPSRSEARIESLEEALFLWRMALAKRDPVL